VVIVIDLPVERQVDVLFFYKFFCAKSAAAARSAVARLVDSPLSDLEPISQPSKPGIQSVLPT